MSDYVDDRLDGIEFAPRGGVWRNRFREERKNVERKNKELKLLRAENARLRASMERLSDAADELIEVADLRGDSTLPEPCDDPLLWTARMQTAWNELRAALAGEEETPNAG